MGFALVAANSRHDHPPGRTLHARLANLVLAPTAVSLSPPQMDTTIPQGVANLLLAPQAASSSPLLDGEHHHPPGRHPPPGWHFFIIAATDDENEHPSGRRPPSGFLKAASSSPLWMMKTTVPHDVANLLLAPKAASSSPLRAANTTVPQRVTCTPPPGFQSGFFGIAATDEYDHPSRRRPPPGSQKSAASPSPLWMMKTTVPTMSPIFLHSLRKRLRHGPCGPANTTVPQRVTLLLASGAASSASPLRTNTTIPQGVALLLGPKAASSSALQTANVANFVQAPRAEEKHIASHVPRWGVGGLPPICWRAKAWALYRERLNRFASLIGDREPVVLFRQLPGIDAQAKRYVIALADDDRASLDKFCEKLTAAGSTCDVMRNEFGP